MIQVIFLIHNDLSLESLLSAGIQHPNDQSLLLARAIMNEFLELGLEFGLLVSSPCWSLEFCTVFDT